VAYFLDLTIPKNTPVALPVTEELKIAPGVVKRVSILLPDGAAGLAGVRVMYWERQVWPDNPGGWFVGNGSPVDFSPNAEIVESPTVLRIEGYNLDDTFDHTALVMVDVEFAGGWWDRLVQRLQGTAGPLALPGR
jgi:hypothetical protein